VYCCTGQAVVNQLYIYIYVTVMFYMHIFIPECYQMQANARWQVSQRGVGLALVWRWFRRWIVQHAALVTNAKPTPNQREPTPTVSHSVLKSVCWHSVSGKISLVGKVCTHTRMTRIYVVVCCESHHMHPSHLPQTFQNYNVCCLNHGIVSFSVTALTSCICH
jgi:hypothetical protein